MIQYFPIVTGSLTVLGNISVSGSITTSGSITISGSITSASFASTASYWSGSIVNAQTASHALNGGVTQILAGANVTIAPTNGKGQVTISATGGGGSNFNTATGSYGSFYDTTTQTNPVANTPRSMSFNTTDITNGVSISGSTSPFNTYIKTENPGVYDIQFSAQLDKTDAGKDEIVIWLRKNGTDLTDTATSISLTNNNDKVVAAWNWFVNSAANDYYQIIWYSADPDLRILAETAGGGHPGIPSVIATVNRVDQFLSNTGSFSGSFNGNFTGSLFGTASNAVSASYAATASYADNFTVAGTLTAQTLVVQTITSSVIYSSGSNIFGNDLTNTQVLTGSVIVTGSLAVNGSNVILTNQTASMNVATSSYTLSAVSSSYATTASYAKDFVIGTNGTFTFDQTLTDYFSVASSIVGANNLFTQTTGSYTSAFFNYTVANGTDARTGQVMAIWNGGSVQYADNSTQDLGTTNAVTASVAIVSNQVQFNIQTNTSGWTIKSIATFM